MTLALLVGFDWLTGDRVLSLIAAVCLALIGGIGFAWLDWFVARMLTSRNGRPDDQLGPSEQRFHGRRW